MSEDHFPTNDYSDTGPIDAPASAPADEPILDPGTRVQAQAIQYRVKTALGRGAMGAAYIVHTPSEDEAVIKHPFNTAVAFDSFKQELAYHRKLQESKPGLTHVARLIDSGIMNVHPPGGPSYPHPAMILERLYENPYRFFGRKALPLDIGIELLTNLLYTVHELGTAGVVHADIAPKNIMCRPNIHVKRAERALLEGSNNLLEKMADRIRKYEYAIAFGEYQPVLIDLGCALNRDDRNQDGIIGTPAYLPCEAVRNADSGTKRDVYAAVVSAAQMIFGTEPYNHLTSRTATNNFQRTIRAIKCGADPFDDTALAVRKLSPEFRINYSTDKFYRNLTRILTGGMSHDPTQRHDARDLYDDCITSFEIEESTFTDCNGNPAKRFRQTLLKQTTPEELRQYSR